MNPEMQPRPADEKFDFSDIDAETGKKKPEAEEPEGEVIYDATHPTEEVMSDEELAAREREAAELLGPEELARLQAEAGTKAASPEMSETEQSLKELREIEKQRVAEEAAAKATEAAAEDLTAEAKMEAVPPPIPEEKSETERSLEELRAIEAERVAQEKAGYQEALKTIKEAGQEKAAQAEAAAKKKPIDIASKARPVESKVENYQLADNELEKEFFDQGDRESAAVEAGQELDARRSEDKTGLVERVSKEPMPGPAEEMKIDDEEWLKGQAAEAQERIDDLEDVEKKLHEALRKEFGIAYADTHGAIAAVSPWSRLKLGWRRLTNRNFRETWDQYQRVSNERSELKQLVADINNQLEHPDEWKARKLKESLQHASRGISHSSNRPPSGFIGNKG